MNVAHNRQRTEATPPRLRRTTKHRLRIEVVMSTTTRARKPHTNNGTSGSAPALRAVSDQSNAAKARTESEDKLWNALHANANSTTTHLARVAEIGKSTAGKILAKWHKHGDVTRTPGITTGGHRAADLWAVSDTSTDTDSTELITGIDSGPEAHSICATSPADEATEQTAVKIHPDTTTPSNSTETDGMTPADDKITQGPGTEPRQLAQEDAGTQPTTSTPENSATNSLAVERDANGKRARLKPGVLHGMVEDYLRDHPEDEFGPTKIARDLGKSSGAVNNALERLTKNGTAVKTKEHPKRFSLAVAVE